MNQGLIPRRYAKALFKVALEKGVDADLYSRMTALQQAFADNASLQKVMSNPFVSTADKTQLLTTAAGIVPAEAPKAKAKAKAAEPAPADTLFADFLRLLVDNNRLDLARGIAHAYCDIYREHHNIHVVRLVSATPLDPATLKRLRDMIESRLGGGTMEFTESVDPDIIGGFVVSIDNERLDASVANELSQLRQKLINN